MTVVLRPRHVADDLSLLQIIGGIAVAQAIRSTLDTQAYLRWPNDVVAKDLKLAGVLVETQFKGDSIDFALLGLGVNANFHADELGKEIKEISTSLMDLYGSPIDRVALISSILKEIEQQYDSFCSGRVTEVLGTLRRVECSIGRRVIVKTEGPVFTGIFEDYVTPTKVRVRHDDGSHSTIEASSVLSVKYVCV
jgi:BirA family biotin operon repressor/biotin-[acetyl-CoA-carboxylase] ligase